MKLRRRNLTLLEVLISMTFVALFMVPLLSPHVTFYQTHRKLVQGIKEQLEADNWYASFYEDLLKGNRNWDSLPIETSESIDKPNGTYIIEYKDKTGEKGESYFMTLIITTKTARKFTYYFVVKGKADENQKEAPNAA